MTPTAPTTTAKPTAAAKADIGADPRAFTAPAFTVWFRRGSRQQWQVVGNASTRRDAVALVTGAGADWWVTESPGPASAG